MACSEHFPDHRGIFGHLARKHQETTVGGAICPYRPSTFSNLANLKIHIRDKICPNRPQTNTSQIWTEITKANPPTDAQNEKSKINDAKKKERTRIYIQNELRLGRISYETNVNGETWQCLICNRKKQNLTQSHVIWQYYMVKQNQKIYCVHTVTNYVNI